MPQLPLSVGKEEYHDGTSWFSLASENWVLNNIGNIPPCIVATITNLTATYSSGTAGVGATLTNSGTQVALVIDGVTLTAAQRVLVKDQTAALQNGIYVVTNIGSISTNWILTRVTDFDSAIQMTRGDVIRVISGTINAVTTWMLTSVVTTVGSDSLIFANLIKNTITNVLGTSNQITVTVSGGVATVSIASDPVFLGTGSITIPVGTTAQRPASPTIGMLRINTSL